MQSFVVPIDELMKKTNPKYNQMNDITAATIYAIPDPSVKALIPPPLEIADPALLIIYVSNIKSPTFTAPYMEGGMGILTKLTDENGVVRTGLYYFSLQLCGAGSQNAIFMGREEAGLPKKFAGEISLKYAADKVFLHIKRNGVMLLNAELQLGRYNDPHFTYDYTNDGGVLTHRYNSDDARGLHNMQIFYYNSTTDYSYYQPAYAKVKLQSSAHDPWGEIKIAKILGGSLAKNNNAVVDVTKVFTYPDTDAIAVMQYLYAGRFDPLPKEGGIV